MPSYFIRRYGVASNFDTATYEKFHQDVVKKPAKRDARRNEGMVDRIFTLVQSATLLTSHMSESKYCVAFLYTPNTQPLHIIYSLPK